MIGHVLAQEALAQLFDRRGLTLGIAFGRGIAPVLGLGDELDRLLAGELRRHRAMHADVDPAQPTVRPALGDIDFLARGIDPEPKAAQLVVPNETVHLAGRGGIDNPLRELRHTRLVPGPHSIAGITPESFGVRSPVV